MPNSIKLMPVSFLDNF